MKKPLPPDTVAVKTWGKDTCVFRGVVLSNPFTIACSDPALGLMSIGRSFDGEFLITHYKRDLDSLHVVERIGALVVRHVGPLAEVIHSPVSEFDWMRLRMLGSPRRPFPVKAEIRAARRLRAMAVNELARRKGGAR